jgi:hypothetical protein
LIEARCARRVRVSIRESVDVLSCQPRDDEAIADIHAELVARACTSAARASPSVLARPRAVGILGALQNDADVSGSTLGIREANRGEAKKGLTGIARGTRCLKTAVPKVVECRTDRLALDHRHVATAARDPARVDRRARLRRWRPGRRGRVQRCQHRSSPDQPGADRGLFDETPSGLVHANPLVPDSL